MATITHTNGTAELTDEGYDLADAVDLWLENHKGYHTPSTVARGVKATNSVDVWQVLNWMDHQVLVMGSGNGRLRRYQSRMYR